MDNQNTDMNNSWYVADTVLILVLMDNQNTKELGGLNYVICLS